MQIKILTEFYILDFFSQCYRVTELCRINLLNLNRFWCIHSTVELYLLLTLLLTHVVNPLTATVAIWIQL